MRFIAIAFVAASCVYGGEILTNTPAWDGSTNVFAWGVNGFTPTFGQTITVPTDGNSTLSSFTFNIFRQSLTDNFDAYVQAWNGSETTGSPLFTASSSLITGSGDQTYTFNPNLALTPGATYVLYISVLGVTNTVSDWYNVGATGPDTYSGGAFVYSNTDSGTVGSGVTATNAGSVADLNGSAWTITGEAEGATFVRDLAFSATFTGSSVPEPQTYGIAALGLALIAAGRRLRRARLAGADRTQSTASSRS